MATAASAKKRASFLKLVIKYGNLEKTSTAIKVKIIRAVTI
jgi:hypothetical protein